MISTSLKTYLLTGCLVAGMGVAAIAQTESTTSTTSTTATSTDKSTKCGSGKHHWHRKCHLKKLFHKKSSTAAPATTAPAAQ